MLPTTTETAAPQALRQVPAPVPAVLPTTPVTNAPFQPDKVRHLLFGTARAVEFTIKDLHHRGYAEPNDWSKLLPTGREGEVMVVLTRRVEEEDQLPVTG